MITAGVPAGIEVVTPAGISTTSTLKGKSEQEAAGLFERFHRLVTEDAGADPHTLGKLAVFSGVREFPARVKCASLAWHTLRAALEGTQDKITTE